MLDVLVYIERPRQVLELALREGGQGGAGLDVFRELLRRHLFRRLLPEVQAAGNAVEQSGLQGEDERLAVRLREREEESKRDNGRDDENGRYLRQEVPDDVRRSGPAHHIHELLDGEGSEELVLDVYELGNLKTHDKTNQPITNLLIPANRSPLFVAISCISTLAD